MTRVSTLLFTLSVLLTFTRLVVAAPENTTADAVIGQADFTTNQANQGGAASATTMNGNRGLFVDSTGRLWVADTSNNRVLMFNSATGFANGDPANLVLGQADFAGDQCNRGNANPSKNTTCGPRSVVVDSAGRVYVADSDNKRILRYDPPFSNGMDAEQVFGQNGDFTTKNQAAMNAATADNLGNPDGLGIDPQDNLFCADRFLSRVVRYNTPATTDTTADLVIGQANLNSGDPNRGATPAINSLNRSIGCCIDKDGNLYVADEFNNRVMLFKAPLTNGMDASRVYGQPNFTSDTANNGGVSATSLNQPVYVAVDPVSGNLFVADGPNMRILEYNDPQNDSTADRVYGQGGDFTTNTVNKGGVSADSINDVGGVATDAGGSLYAGDRLNSRVLRYNKAPDPNDPNDPNNPNDPNDPNNPGGGDGMVPCGLCAPGMSTMMPFTLISWIWFTRRKRNSLR